MYWVFFILPLVLFLAACGVVAGLLLIRSRRP